VSGLVSVIVLSRDRPSLLRRALTSLKFQTYRPFEVIVVGDAAARQTVDEMGLGPHLGFVPFSEPNVAAGRNAGIASARGDVLAFMDDDAVAEPFWVSGIREGFQATGAMIVGGFVRARNGITYQWRGERVSDIAEHRTESLPDDRISLLHMVGLDAPEVMGTNCAYRALALREIGGFDARFAYYLDESDVNYRLAKRGAATAIVPWAQVHHALAPGGHRGERQVPRTLAPFARSLRVFLDKHARHDRHDAAIELARKGHRVRLLRHNRAGRLAPEEVERLLADFDEVAALSGPGVADYSAPVVAAPEFPATGTADRAKTLVSRSSGGAVAEQAAEHAKAGAITSHFALSPTTLYHRVSFTDDGVWRQTGGIWGRSIRSQPLVQAGTRSARLKREMQRLARIRPFGSNE